MNIDRHNYEEFFILYVDNELSLSDRKAVDRFIQENPDLEEELVMLQQSKFIPEDDVVFGNKASLLKAVVGSPINMDNYEEWLVLYTDNELTGHQKNAVEQFAAASPAAQKQLELFQKTRLQAEENIVFPDKESLYRTEEKVKVVAIRWWRIAAAAIVLFAIGGTGLLLLNEPAGNNNKVAEAGNQQPLVRQPNSGQETRQIPENITPNNESAASTPVVSGEEPDKNRSGRNNTLADYTPSTEKITEDPVKNAVAIDESVKKTNNLAQPSILNPYTQSDKQVLDLIAANDNSPTKDELINSDLNVTLDKDPSLNIINASLPENEVAGADQPDKKSSVRGFLRKITRTFEKTTNIKATDEDDRLLVGGLAIKL